jgi:receptor protein-tyrosine kinase
MTLKEFGQVLRARWVIICFTIAAAVLGVTAYTWLATPMYEASTRLFVSTTAASKTPYDAYQGTLFTEQRVVSYSKLIMGETLAQRTVDKLHLDMSATELQREVKASAADTALIDVSVRDPSPVRAREIADAMSDELVVMVGELEAPAQGDKRDARVVVQQHASTPSTPVIPKTTLNFAVAFALGALLGIGLAVLRDRLDTTVRHRRTLEEVTGVGLLANIPLDKDRRRDPAISFARDDSAIAEAFRKLRTNLQFFDIDNTPRFIVVTSPLPGEGKSTTAINIALAFADAGQNVVLVDGDMRQPQLADYFGLVGSVGLSTVLTGEAALHEVLQTTRYEGLTLVAAGASVPNPSELLGSTAATKILHEMRSHFDYVIVDSSALLPVTDAAVLAAQADGALLIGRFARTKRAQLADAATTLRNVDARILGAIFTMTPAPRSKSFNPSYHGGRPAPSDVRSVNRERRESRNPLRSRRGRHTPDSTRSAHGS